MSIGSRIKERREFLKLTRNNLAGKIGVTASAIANYENEVSTPKIELLYKLFDALQCDANYLYQDDIKKIEEFRVSFAEQTLINKFRRLDTHGKEVVKNLLDAEYRRMEELKKTVTDSKKPQTRFIDFYHLPVSAGTGIEITDETSDMIEVTVDDTTRHADYVLRVSGKSMEPLYEDGDLILVQSMPTVDIGDLGIFIVNNEAFFKKRGKTELISLNSKFPNVPLSEFDRIDCKGKVLGKIKKS